MKKFHEWCEGQTPPKPGNLQMSDDDWKHQYTSGNLETILDTAEERILSLIPNKLRTIKNQVYSQLYRQFEQMESKEIEKMAIKLMWQALITNK